MSLPSLRVGEAADALGSPGFGVRKAWRGDRR